MKNIFFIGSGGHFKETFNWYKDQINNKNLKSNIKGIIDDKSDLKIEKNTKLKILKSKQVKNEKNNYLILSIGSINKRKSILKKFKNYNFENLIHPSATISSMVKFGKGNIFSPNVVLSGDAKLGNFNNLNPNSIISHDCIIGDNNFLSSVTSLMGNCYIGNNNFFGVGSTMIPKTSLKNNNIVGAGAVIIKSFQSEKTLVGVPAKSIK
jgi:sugar O-acyltransferase (sialic acid O-acetyltransferase NeuD family)